MGSSPESYSIELPKWHLCLTGTEAVIQVRLDPEGMLSGSYEAVQVTSLRSVQGITGTRYTKYYFLLDVRDGQ